MLINNTWHGMNGICTLGGAIMGGGLNCMCSRGAVRGYWFKPMYSRGAVSGYWFKVYV